MDMVQDDKLLAMRISDGDESAFYQFYKAYAPRLRSYIIKTTRSATETEEIIQTVFIRVWLSRDKLPGIENIASWLYTISARLYLQHYRNKKRHQQKIEAYSKGSLENHVDTPLDLLQLEEIRKRVLQVVTTMPETRQKIYRLNREAGKKPAEIASILSMPVGTVKNQLTAANKEIREFLITQGYAGFTLVYIFVKIF